MLATPLAAFAGAPPGDGDLVVARYFLDRCPHRYVGPRCSPPDPQQREEESVARAFVRAHPDAAIAAAREALDGDESQAAKAVRFLTFHGLPEFESVFLELLGREGAEGPPSVTHAAIRFMGSIRSREAVPALIRLGGRRQLLQDVVEALAQIGDPRSVYFLGEVAEAQATYDRTAEKAIRALGAMGDQLAVEPLCRVLENEDIGGGVRAAAAWALADIGDRRAAPVLKRTALKTSTPADDRAPLWALLNLVPEGAAENIRATGDILLSKYLEPEDAEPWLLETFDDPGAEHSGYAALMLAKLGVVGIAARVKERLLFPPANQDAHQFERDRLLRALFILGDPEATTVGLWMVMVSEGWRFPSSLAFHGNRDAMPNFRAMAGGGQWQGILGLSRLGTREDRDVILAYCRTAKWRGRYWPSPEAYLRAAIAFFVREDVHGAVPLLRRWLLEAPSEVRPVVAEALGKLGSPHDAAWILDLISKGKFLCDDTGFAVADAAAAIGGEALLRCLRKPVDLSPDNSDVLAAYCLTRIRPDEGSQQFLEALGPRPDEDDWLAVGEHERAELLVACAMARLGDPSMLRSIDDRLTPYTEERMKLMGLKALGRLGATAAGRSRHVEGLTISGSLDIRRAALTALGEIGDRASIAFLRAYPIGRRLDVIDDLTAAREALEKRLGPGKGASAHDVVERPKRRFFEAPMAPRDSTILRYIELCREVASGARVGYHREWSALRSLEYVADPRSVPALLGILRLPPDPFRHDARVDTAAATLRKIGRAAADAVLAEYATGPPHFKRRALRFLGSVRDERAAGIIAEAIREGSIDAMYAARDLGAATLVPALESVVRDGSRSKARCAAKSLEVIGDGAARDALLRLIAVENTYKQRDVFRALGNLGEKRAIPLLVERLKSESWFSRRANPDLDICLRKLTGRPCYLSQRDWRRWLDANPVPDVAVP